MDETFEFIAKVRFIMTAENASVAEQILRDHLEQISYDIESIEEVK